MNIKTLPNLRMKLWMIESRMKTSRTADENEDELVTKDEDEPVTKNEDELVTEDKDEHVAGEPVAEDEE